MAAAMGKGARKAGAKRRSLQGSATPRAVKRRTQAEGTASAKAEAGAGMMGLEGK